MATASSRKHLISQLSRKVGSSYSEDEFTTASSFDAARDAIHSTAQLPEDISQQVATQEAHTARGSGPASYLLNFTKDHKWNRETLDFDSTDMSIEQGRGVKKLSHKDPDFAAKWATDWNEMNGLTPETRLSLDGFEEERPVQRKKDDGLKRQTSGRRAAADSVKANGQAKPFTSMKGRALAEALKQIGAEDDSSFIAEDTAQHTATFNTRNTRFTRTKQPSVNEPAIPKHKAAANESANPTRITSASAQSAGGNNPTVQSNSFVLPNLPNLNELVTGARKDGTPIKTRNTSSGSRFTSASYKATQQEHHRIGKLAVPEEEKAIFASLQLLKSQSEHMEMELAEARKRNEEYESEIIDLRSQLSVVHRRPDSALGSDDDVSDHGQWQEEKRSLEASVKALQDRHNRSERKISVTEIAAKRVTKERDQLMSDLAATCCSNEELKAENTAYKEDQTVLQAENADLKEEVDALRKENQDLRLLMAQTEASYKHDALQREKAALKQKGMQNSMQAGKENSGIWQVKDSVEMIEEVPLRSRKEAKGSTKDVPRASRPKSVEVGEETMQDDLMKRIAQEIQKHRESSAAKSQGSLQKRASQEKVTTGHSRSKSDTTQQQLPGVERKTSTTRRPVSAPVENTAPKRPSSAPIQSNASDTESTTQLDFSQHARAISREDSLPTMIRHPRPATQKDEDSRDLTLLSWQDPEEVLSMRKKLEGELRAGSLKSTRSQSGGKATASLPDLNALRSKAEEDEKRARASQEKLTEARSILLASGEGPATQQTAQKAPLKSNLKDIAAMGDDDHSTRFTVNGQTYIFPKMAKSIEGGDTGDISILSNTSNTSNTSRRRRRSMASAEAMTSDFIVPDITFNGGEVSMADTATMAAHVNDNDKDVRSFTNVSIADSLTMAYMKEKNDRAEVRLPSPVNAEVKAGAAEPVIVEPQALPPSPVKPKSRFRVPSPYVEYKEPDPVQGKSRYRVPTPHVEYQAPDPATVKPKYRVPTPLPLEAIQTMNEETVESPVPVSEREDVDDTAATIRPAQTPPIALATVIKQLQEEIRHLKINLAVQQRAYAKHDPSISKRKRVATKALMDHLTAEIEKRSDQVYALYDVLEGQKEAAAKAKKAGKQPTVMDEQQVEDTLSSLGIDPAEFANNVTIERKSQQTSWMNGV